MKRWTLYRGKMHEKTDGRYVLYMDHIEAAMLAHPVPSVPAEARIAELEALVRKLQKVLSICRERLQHDKAQKAKRSGAGTSISLRKVDHLLGIISAALVESQAGGKEER